MAALTWLMLMPGIALAAGSGQGGVHVDPNSPAGHEYVLPINAARGETAAGTGGSGGTSGSGLGNPPLFGVGITPAGVEASPSARATASGRRDHAAKTRRPSKSRNSSGFAGSGSVPPPPSGNGADGGGNSGSGNAGWLALAGGGFLVLLLGGGGGFALRRRMSRV